jgi:hypothetical protein|tara:strand:+ start:228 stop:581 length:354 start_codon:yes stop_codon:yes gene_type:complete
MIKGALISIILVFVILPIPIVHFFVPIMPFIGGFIGGGIAKADKGRIIIFSLVTAGITFIPCSIILIYSIIQYLNEADVMGINPVLAIVLAIAFIPYTWFANLVGALISYTARSRAN